MFTTVVHAHCDSAHDCGCTHTQRPPSPMWLLQLALHGWGQKISKPGGWTNVATSHKAQHGCTLNLYWPWSVLYYFSLKSRHMLVYNYQDLLMRPCTLHWARVETWLHFSGVKIWWGSHFEGCVLKSSLGTWSSSCLGVSSGQPRNLIKLMSGSRFWSWSMASLHALSDYYDCGVCMWSDAVKCSMLSHFLNVLMMSQILR